MITDLVYDIYREQSFALILVGKSKNGGYSLFLPNARSALSEDFLIQMARILRTMRRQLVGCPPRPSQGMKKSPHTLGGEGKH